MDSLFYFSDNNSRAVYICFGDDGDDEEIIGEYAHTCTKVYSFAMGLFLCEPYAVSNPALPNLPERPIPTPPLPHLALLPRALVVDDRVFHVICALPSTDTAYTTGAAHAFHVYSSNTDTWALSADHVLGRIRADTGVSCGTRAFWLTETPSIVYYDVADGLAGIMPIPRRFWDAEGMTPNHFQLGRWDADLCFVVSTDFEVELYALGPSRKWRLIRHEKFPQPRRALVPIRFETEEKSRVPFWDGRRFVAWDLDGTAAADSAARWRRQRYDVQGLPSSVADIVQYMDTPLNPTDDFPVERNLQ